MEMVALVVTFPTAFPVKFPTALNVTFKPMGKLLKNSAQRGFGQLP
jgi:hypothetical protein